MVEGSGSKHGDLFTSDYQVSAIVEGEVRRCGKPKRTVETEPRIRLAQYHHRVVLANECDRLPSVALLPHDRVEPEIAIVKVCRM